MMSQFFKSLSKAFLVTGSLFTPLFRFTDGTLRSSLQRVLYYIYVHGCFLVHLINWLYTGFVRVLENLESPGILLRHFPGLESRGKRPLVLESSGNLLNSAIK